MGERWYLVCMLLFITACSPGTEQSGAAAGESPGVAAPSESETESESATEDAPASAGEQPSAADQTGVDEGAPSPPPPVPVPADGPIPGLSATSLYGVHYGDWTDALIQDVIGATGAPAYHAVIAHPNTNLTPARVAALQAGGVQVFCYLSIGEDDHLHTNAASGGVAGPAGYASWYYDADGDGQVDQNGIWGSYFANVADPAWRAALRTYRNEGTEGWYGYDYLIHTLGCDGLFLDTVDTVSPAAWGGPYSGEITAMIDLLAEVRAYLPTDRYLIINRGLFYFDPYDAMQNPEGLTEVTVAMQDRVRQLVHGVMYENFMDDALAEREYWGTRLDAQGDQPDGFTIFSLDYVANPATASTAQLQAICAATRGTYGWLPYVSTVDLQTFYHAVRAHCTAASDSGVDPILVGAGDIATCWSDADEATAQLLDDLFAPNPPGRVMTLGDNAYDSGTLQEYQDCYEPTWGRHKSRTVPSAGNHEYGTTNAQGYFDYFGAAAGEFGKGYYSYDLGTWHIVVLNSNCMKVGGCTTDSAQYQWLVDDLAQTTAPCTLAYWHRPRFSSGTEHGSSTRMKAAWQALYDAGAEVIVVGHEHHYERFAPQTATGVADAAQGIRQFVVGTGGADLYPLGPPIANSEVQNATTHGVLKLTLHPTSYTWEFLPIAGQTFTDSGSTVCH